MHAYTCCKWRGTQLAIAHVCVHVRVRRALTSLHTLRVARGSTRDGDVCACMIALLRRHARTLGLPARSCSLNRSRWGSGDVGRSRGCNLFRIRGQPGTAATGAWDSFRRSRGRVQTHLPMPGREAAGCVASGEELNSPARVYVYVYTHTRSAHVYKCTYVASGERLNSQCAARDRFNRSEGQLQAEPGTGATTRAKARASDRRMCCEWRRALLAVACARIHVDILRLRFSRARITQLAVHSKQRMTWGTPYQHKKCRRHNAGDPLFLS